MAKDTENAKQFRTQCLQTYFVLLSLFHFFCVLKLVLLGDPHIESPLPLYGCYFTRV